MFYIKILIFKGSNLPVDTMYLYFLKGRVKLRVELIKDWLNGVIEFDNCALKQGPFSSKDQLSLFGIETGMARN